MQVQHRRERGTYQIFCRRRIAIFVVVRLQEFADGCVFRWHNTGIKNPTSSPLVISIDVCSQVTFPIVDGDLTEKTAIGAEIIQDIFNSASPFIVPIAVKMR